MDESGEVVDEGLAIREQLNKANERLIQAELKNHAIRAGIIDLDCLRLIDASSMSLDDQGNVPDAQEAVARLKRDKAWLFANPNSSQPAPAPAPAPPRPRLAKDMTDQEWRAARERLIRGR